MAYHDISLNLSPDTPRWVVRVVRVERALGLDGPTSWNQILEPGAGVEPATY